MLELGTGNFCFPFSIFLTVFCRFDPTTAWSGGKDSTTVLHLIKQEFGKVIIPVVFIDTSVKFPEIYAFRDKLAKEWNLNLIIIKNENALKEIEIAKDKKECCYLLKTLPLRQIIEKNGWQALITAVRWDEQEARKNEVYISPRENPPHFKNPSHFAL
ncbi:Sulfate adenylyltransferase subunit 2 [Candidatus Methanoperedenaceae archaeon GB37]|nr:Sulfate adenylyltransferase subunit 2 [Candidatus Methanoperedenaceae archaeon GB37]